MPDTVLLPQENGTLQPYQMRGPANFAPPEKPLQSRVVYAAAHVVPNADASDLDWDATLAYRHHLWSYGMAIAEAMDTAQRGMGLDWKASQELIRRSLAEAKTVGGKIACGAGTDHLELSDKLTIKDVVAAYEEQVGFVQGEGGRIILMASRALARCARSFEDYRRVYNRILGQVSQPVILHWLGDMFDPALAGYWGSSDLNVAMDNVLQVIAENADKIDGIKLSLLDADKELQMRARLPAGVRMYTGDDFNYVDLILGDGEQHSDALLGIFDAIAPAASAGIQALDRGDIDAYRAALEPTVALSRHIFQAPTYHYKTGIVFMAYLNGHQEEFRMVGGQETARSATHLAELFRLADGAGLLHDPELAMARMTAVLAVMGIA
jgi:hypothetical protein